MHRWLSIAAVLCVAVATPLVAQQASIPASRGAAAAPASSARTTLPGPRLQPEWRSSQPAFADSSASSSSPAVSGSNTFTISTVVLVLVVIIVVLLIAK